jgi:predicted MFS family arabinose efflux permease
MLTFSAATDGSAIGLVILALVLSGAGIGLSSPSVSASIANAVDEDDLGIASSAQQLMTQVGLVAGIQLMSTVQAQAGFTAAFRLGAAVCVLGAVFGWCIRSRTRERGAPEGAPLEIPTPD